MFIYVCKCLLTQEDKMNKRESIIQATVDVVAKQGISESPTSQIAKEADAAEITLFRLFGNKQELLNQTYDEVIQRFQEKCWRKVENIEDLEKKLVELLKVAIKYFRKYQNELTYLQEYTHTYEGLLRRPDLQDDLGKDTSSFPLASILHEGKTQGVFKNLPMTGLFGLASAALIMTLRTEQIRNKRFSKKEMDLLIQACTQAVKV
jgi:AcrR family transcriptional regulator